MTEKGERAAGRPSDRGHRGRRHRQSWGPGGQWGGGRRCPGLLSGVLPHGVMGPHGLGGGPALAPALAPPQLLSVPVRSPVHSLDHWTMPGLPGTLPRGRLIRSIVQSACPASCPQVPLAGPLERHSSRPHPRGVRRERAGDLLSSIPSVVLCLANPGP